MGLVYKVFLHGDKILGCNACKTHFATNEHIMSKVRKPTASNEQRTMMSRLDHVLVLKLATSVTDVEVTG